LVKYKTFHLNGQKKEAENACFITPTAKQAIHEEPLQRIHLPSPPLEIPVSNIDLRSNMFYNYSAPLIDQGEFATQETTILLL